MDRLVAIDPGRSGGIAWLDWLGDVHGAALPAATIPRLDRVRELLHEVRPTLVVIEDVGYHRSGNAAQASASLARQVGELEATVRALDLEIFWVNPKTWPKCEPLTLLPRCPRMPKDADSAEKKRIRGAFSRQRKNLIKRMMAETYPNIRMTLATADAVAMLHCAMNARSIRTTLETRRALQELRSGSGPTPTTDQHQNP